MPIGMAIVLELPNQLLASKLFNMLHKGCILELKVCLDFDRFEEESMALLLEYA